MDIYGNRTKVLYTESRLESIELIHSVWHDPICNGMDEEKNVQERYMNS